MSVSPGALVQQVIAEEQGEDVYEDETGPGEIRADSAGFDSGDGGENGEKCDYNGGENDETFDYNGEENGENFDYNGADADSVGGSLHGMTIGEDELRSPTTSRIPVWVRPKDADRDSGVDEGKDADQSVSPQKVRSPSKRIQGATAQEKQKKVPMNKIQVGTGASPNIKNVKSRVGSLANASYKPGGGNIKIESHKVDMSKAAPKVKATSTYKSQGGNKKIESHKVEWSAQSKVGSMKNATHKPGGGNVKVTSQKLEFKASAKVGSRDNIQHKPGGGDVKVETVKLDLSSVGSRICSLDNVNHKPQGGDKKIFNDTELLRQISSGSGEGRSRRRSQADSIGELPLCTVPADPTIPRFENVEFLAMACMGNVVNSDSSPVSFLVLLFKTLHYLRWFLPMDY